MTNFDDVLTGNFVSSGVWSPVLEDESANEATMSGEAGQWRKIGDDLIIIQATIKISSKGSMGNNLRVKNLPFTSVDGAGGSAGTMTLGSAISSSFLNNSVYSGVVLENVTYIALQRWNTGETTGVDASDISAAFDIEITAVYLAA